MALHGNFNNVLNSIQKNVFKVKSSIRLKKIFF